MGLPSISTKVSGATDLIADHKNGLLVELDDQSEFENAILELLDNRKLMEDIAENAVKLNEQLELSKIMNQWIEFIDSVKK